MGFWNWLKELFTPKKETPTVIRPKTEPDSMPTSGSLATDAWFGAKWVRLGVTLLGMIEADPKLAKILVPWWKRVGLSSFSSLIGKNNAWCSLVMDYLIVQAGFKGTSNAMALSWRTWGRVCPYWFGAILGLRHASGGGHVTIFLYWIDESRMIAACMGGNQSNAFNVTAYNLSGNRNGFEEVVNGPRWPKGHVPGRSLTASEVQNLFKHTVVGAGSTR
jgi:hypothetical protein